MVADRLGIEYYNRDLVDKVVAQIGVDKGLVEEADTKIGVRYAFDTSYGVRYANLSNRVIDAQFQAINDFANRSSCVIVGRSSDYILRNRDDVLNVFIYAPQEDEIAAVMKEKVSRICVRLRKNGSLLIRHSMQDMSILQERSVATGIQEICLSTAAS